MTEAAATTETEQEAQSQDQTRPRTNTDTSLSEGDSDSEADWEPTLPPEDNEPPPPPPDDEDDPRTPPPSPPDSDYEWGDGGEDEAYTPSAGTGTDTYAATSGSENFTHSGSDSGSSSGSSSGSRTGESHSSSGSSSSSGGDSDTEVDIRMKVTPEGVKPVTVPASVFRRRRSIAMEIVSTETTYVSQLTTVVQLFVLPLQRKEFELSQADIVSLFSNIEVLRKLHSRMLQELKPRVQDWQDTSCIGDVFFKNSKWIKLYKHYVNNYDSAIEFLSALRKKNSKVRKYLKEHEYTPAMGNMNLEAYLVVPVQRIPRYVLLLRDLLRNTPETHTDYVPIEGALRMIEEVATYINAHKAVSDAMRTLSETMARIQNMPFDIVIPNRQLLREAVFVVNKEKRKVFVFNDLIILAGAESRRGKHKYKGHITLA